MKKFKALSLAALAAATAFIPTTAQARNVDNAHMELARAIVSTGVQLKINPVECKTKNAMGWYWAARNEMVICQENARGSQEVNWTAEDFDTLRHEAQHLIQDCMNGHLDGNLGSVYKDPIALAKGTLTQRQIKAIIESYAENGASEHIIIMELEAFSVAAMNDPAEQAGDIAKYCF